VFSVVRIYPLLGNGSINTQFLTTEEAFSMWFAYIRCWETDVCEYLHRDPASLRRRRKGKSQSWDSNWDSDPRKTALARVRSIYNRQTRPLVREGAPQKTDRNCQRVINIWSRAADRARHEDLLIGWPSVAMWLWLCQKPVVEWEREWSGSSAVKEMGSAGDWVWVLVIDCD
jgi:hypothetical protein